MNFTDGEPSPKEPKEEGADSEDEDANKEIGTVSPEEIEKLQDEIIENQKENSETFGLPLTSSPEEVDAFLNKEEKELGEDLPEAIEKDLGTGEDFKSMVLFLELFDKVKSCFE